MNNKRRINKIQKEIRFLRNCENMLRKNKSKQTLLRVNKLLKQNKVNLRGGDFLPDWLKPKEHLLNLKKAYDEYDKATKSAYPNSKGSDNAWNKLISIFVKENYIGDIKISKNVIDKFINYLRLMKQEANPTGQSEIRRSDNAWNELIINFVKENYIGDINISKNVIDKFINYLRLMEQEGNPTGQSEIRKYFDAYANFVDTFNLNFYGDIDIKQENNKLNVTFDKLADGLINVIKIAALWFPCIGKISTRSIVEGEPVAGTLR